MSKENENTPAETLENENDRETLNEMLEKRQLNPADYANKTEAAQAIADFDEKNPDQEEIPDLERVVEDEDVVEESRTDLDETNATFVQPEPAVKEPENREGKTPVEKAREENATELAEQVEKEPDHEQTADEAGVPRPGSMDAAFGGVQQDASGHAESVTRTNSDKSGVRI